ncbi:hypothetical protein TYRP_021519 [Tyrophagus putrescentiae]|nr:hypothetical protein TYRP_021519 [Tyrophagus putrescentiae]
MLVCSSDTELGRLLKPLLLLLRPEELCGVPGGRRLRNELGSRCTLRLRPLLLLLASSSSPSSPISPSPPSSPAFSRFSSQAEQVELRDLTGSQKNTLGLGGALLRPDRSEVVEGAIRRICGRTAAAAGVTEFSWALIVRTDSWPRQVSMRVISSEGGKKTLVLVSNTAALYVHFNDTKLQKTVLSCALSSIDICQMTDDSHHHSCLRCAQQVIGTQNERWQVNERREVEMENRRENNSGGGGEATAHVICITAANFRCNLFVKS